MRVNGGRINPKTIKKKNGYESEGRKVGAN